MRFLHVPRHESRSVKTWRTMRLDVQSQLRRAAGKRRPNAFSESRDGRRRCCSGSFCRYSKLGVLMKCHPEAAFHSIAEGSRSRSFVPPKAGVREAKKG